jgi:hypothetical protein
MFFESDVRLLKKSEDFLKYSKKNEGFCVKKSSKFGQVFIHYGRC